MSRGSGRFSSASIEFDEAAKTFFEPKLEILHLTMAQIQQQDLDQLQASLERVNDAMQRPESFGVLKLKVTGEAGTVIVSSKTESHIEVGILPLLLERKALILERINTLRPAEQIKDFRQEVIDSVADPKVRDQLLEILDEHDAHEQELSSRIQKEASEVTSALAAEASSLLYVTSLAKLEARMDALDKVVSKLEDRSVAKFDVVVIVFAILAALGGLTGAILGIIKWATG